MTYRLYVYEKGPQKGVKEPGIYQDDQGRKYLRVRESGRDSFISLRTNSIGEAIKLRDQRAHAKTAAKLGVTDDPEEAAKTAAVTVPTVIRRYEADGYPTKKGVPRNDGKHLKAEKSYCVTLLEYFNGEKAAAKLTQNDLDQYKDWRVAQVAEGSRKNSATGLRTVDLELNCLNNAMRWAVRKTLFNVNPIVSRARYYTASAAKHCREFAVATVDELHQVAGRLMSSFRSETLGWQLLFEGLTGLRTEETVRLRMDARPDEPGGLTEDGGSLCVRRADKSKKKNPYVFVNDGLKRVIKAHKIWHKNRYPQSPWYFPGRSKKASVPIHKSSLTKSLDRLYKAKELEKKFTSHGAGRAFYVLARRSQGDKDPQIAYDIGHTGGIGTLEQVYALPPSHWQNGHAPKWSWVPKGSPAWTHIKNVDFSALKRRGRRQKCSKRLTSKRRGERQVKVR